MLDCLNTVQITELPQYGRLRKVTSDDWPFSAQGIVRIHCTDCTSYYSSGTIIGSRFVITSASNIYLPNKEAQHIIQDSIHFTPYSHTKNSPPIKVSKIYFPEEYKSTGKDNYAILVLDKDISDIKTYFELQAFSREDLINQLGYIYGCPYSIHGRLLTETCLWGTQVSFEVDEVEDKLSYNLDTAQGLSGSVVYIQKDGKFYLIGVHTEEFSDEYGIGYATYLNSARISRIKEWLVQYCVDYLDLPHSNQSDSAHLSADFFSNNLLQRYFSTLESLNFQRSSLQDDSLPNLALRRFSRLSKIDLSFNKIGPKGVQYLVTGNLDMITTLNLAYNRLGPSGAFCLYQFLPINLQVLNLDGNGIGDCMVYRGNYARIKSLSVMCNGIRDNGARAIAVRFPNLVYLNLGSNLVGDVGASAIARGMFLKIEYLNLENNVIGHLGGRDLARCNLERIRELYLGGNRLGDRGAKRFKRLYYQRMEILDISDNDIGEELQERLKRIYEWRLIV